MACSPKVAPPPRTGNDAVATEASVPSSEAPKASSDVPPARDPEPSTEEKVPESSQNGATADDEPRVPAHPLVDGREPDPRGSLPRFRIRHIGMHIGGESNTEEAKRPWLAAIAAQEIGFLRCYRLAHEPLLGGTLGVDLYVTSSGGRPEVRKVRQRLGGDDFESCIRTAFEAIRFSRTARATVLSYSLRFEVEGLR
jgi:hypothetical protein